MFTSQDGAASDQFGASVAISQSIVVVGAPKHNIEGRSDQGAAYVFDCSSASCSLLGKLVASDGEASDQFGFSVDLFGSTIIVGSPYHVAPGNVDEGATYVFDCSSSFSSCIEASKLKASDGEADSAFGYSVGIFESTIVVGAVDHDAGGTYNQGSAYVFDCSLSLYSCNETSKLVSSDGIAQDHFGISVGISGSLIVIGAAYQDTSNQGAAYVFDCSPSLFNCAEISKLTADDAVAHELFGRAVAIYGTTVVVGAHLHDQDGKLNQGAAYVYECSLTLFSCSFTTKLFASDGIPEEDFGYSVDIFGTTIVVGAPYSDDDGFFNFGVAYVYDCSPSGLSCKEIQKLEPSQRSSQGLGWRVGISGSLVVAGALFEDVEGRADQGVAYLFELPCFLLFLRLSTSHKL